MKEKITRILAIALSAGFFLLVLSVFVSDRLYSMSFSAEAGRRDTESAIALIDRAVMLDPVNAELRYRKYELVRLERRARSRRTRPAADELAFLKEALELRPFKAKYHLLYALTLTYMVPEPNIITQEMIVSQKKKAAELKPYSPLYQRLYLEYTEALE